MAKPQKQSIALVIPSPNDPSDILAVLRPPDDDELPGVWGLPAGSLKGNETAEGAARRVARDKLGITLHHLEPIAVGDQERPAYSLTMTLFRGHLAGGAPTLPAKREEPAVTHYADWRWSRPATLEEGALRGSLCCQLCLQHYQTSLR
jgi:ADP-ribose pyrophosphatase YjhB (NUDIX family)